MKQSSAAAARGADTQRDPARKHLYPGTAPRSARRHAPVPGPHIDVTSGEPAQGERVGAGWGETEVGVYSATGYISSAPVTPFLGPYRVCRPGQVCGGSPRCVRGRWMWFGFAPVLFSRSCAEAESPFTKNLRDLISIWRVRERISACWRAESFSVYVFIFIAWAECEDEKFRLEPLDILKVRNV